MGINFSELKRDLKKEGCYFEHCFIYQKLDEIDADGVEPTFESKLEQGLFFCGEVLDFDGRCGGYNLQWAWSSGTAAGRAAASRALKQSDR